MAVRSRQVLATAGVGAVLVAVVAVLGGFGAVPQAALPQFAPGHPFRSGPVSITPAAAASVADHDPITRDELDVPVIAVRVRLANSGVTALRQEARWLRPLVPGIATSASVRTTRDGASDPPVQPGLPVDVVYTWPVPAGAALAVGARVRLGVYEQYLAEDSPLEGVTTAPVLVAVYGTGS